MKSHQIYYIIPIVLAVASCGSPGDRHPKIASTKEQLETCQVDEKLLKDKAVFKISNHMVNVNENGNYERFELDENKTFNKVKWKNGPGTPKSGQLLAEDTEAETDPTGITAAFKQIAGAMAAYQVARFDKEGNYLRDENGEIRYQKPQRLLLYFNGGLNRRQDMRWKACEQVPLMLKDGIFPVFMIWPTSFFRSYGDQIAYIRNGKRVGFRPFTAPLYVIRDLGRGIFLTPTISLSELNRLLETHRRETRDEFYKVAKSLYREDPGDGTRRPATFLYEPGDLVSANSNVLFQAPYGDKRGNYSAPAIDIVHATLWPIRLLTNPFISSFGKTAWENMVRRTRTSVRRPIEYRHDCEIEDAASSNIALSDEKLLDGTLLPCGTTPLLKDGVSPNRLVKLVKKQKRAFPKGIGAFSRFFSMLETCIGVDETSSWHCDERRVSEDARRHLRKMELTVIGHSMGGIVLNELLTSYPDLPYRNIVYMGAAASIRNTSRAIVPILSRAGDDGEPCCAGPRFFNLMLHPLNEARERSLRGFAPTGSLLAWIDEMYNDPVDMEDRTVGQWKNLRAAKHVFPEDVQKRMLFRVFNRQGEDCRHDQPPHPAMHSHFNETGNQFWRPAFWGAEDVRWEGDEPAVKTKNSCPNLIKDG